MQACANYEPCMVSHKNGPRRSTAMQSLKACMHTRCQALLNLSLAFDTAALYMDTPGHPPRGGQVLNYHPKSKMKRITDCHTLPPFIRTCALIY